MKKKKLLYRFNYSIKSRMLLIFVFLICIPSAIFMIYCLQSYSKYALNAIITEKRTIMEEINKNITSDLDYFNSVTLSLYYTKETRNYIDNENYEQESEYIKQSLSSIVNSEKYITSIVLNIGDLVYDIGYQYTHLDDFYAKHNEDVLNSKGKGVWIPTEIIPNTTSRNTKHFVYGRAINSVNHSNVGTLWIFFSDYFFDNALSNSEIKSSSEYFIVAPDKTIITSNNKQTIASKSEAPYISQAIEEKNGYLIYHNEATDSDEIIVFSTAEKIGWTFVTVTNENIVFKDIHNIKNLAVIILLSYLAFIILAYFCLVKLIFKPLEKLSKGMEQISDGNFQQKITVSSHDEIGMLTSNYNVMIEKISNLMDDIRYEEQVKNEERIKVLAMQISPHFIYNTLNTIKWMAVVNKQSNIAKMIESLVKLMQTVSYYINDEIPLGKEMELLDSYVYIQKSRYMNFDIVYDIPEELHQYQICELVLQPLVENSILYAFKEKSEGGKIRISAKLADALYITVSDNGVGFDIEKVEETYQKGQKTDHIGIKNVEERIKINYGQEFGLTIQTAINEGTKIILRLPIILEKTKSQSLENKE